MKTHPVNDCPVGACPQCTMDFSASNAQGWSDWLTNSARHLRASMRTTEQVPSPTPAEWNRQFTKGREALPSAPPSSIGPVPARTITDSQRQTIPSPPLLDPQDARKAFIHKLIQGER